MEAEGGLGSRGEVEGLVKAAGSGAGLPGAAAARGPAGPLSPGGRVTLASLAFGVLICKEKRI